MFNGMLWILCTGAPWRDLPKRYSPWRTVASRFDRWRQAGVFQRLIGTLQQQADVAVQLDWPLHYVDRTIIRAHQHAAEAKREAHVTPEDVERLRMHIRRIGVGVTRLVFTMAS